MKEMMMARKAELEARGKKGFTLMEMLIVVAIIAVLIAIAIPTFTTQLNEARYGADTANARSIYALMETDYMTSGGAGQSDNFKIADAAGKETASVAKGTSAKLTITDATGATQTFSFTGTVGVTFTEASKTAGPTVAVEAFGAHEAQNFGA